MNSKERNVRKKHRKRRAKLRKLGRLHGQQTAKLRPLRAARRARMQLKAPPPQPSDDARLEQLPRHTRAALGRAGLTAREALLLHRRGTLEGTRGVGSVTVYDFQRAFPLT